MNSFPSVAHRILNREESKALDSLRPYCSTQKGRLRQSTHKRRNDAKANSFSSKLVEMRACIRNENLL
jgi:hypothetical protein